MKNDLATKLRSASEALHHGVIENAVGPWIVQIDASALLEIAVTTEDAATEIDRIRAELDTLKAELEASRADADSREQAAKWAGMTDAQKDEAIRQATR